jgi:hypothetical protein
MTDAPAAKTAKPVRVATSLADLASPKISAVLEYDDYDLVVPIRIPSAHEWNQIGYSVPAPVPPTNGVDGNKRPIYDRADPGYLRRMAEAEEERTYRRLLACIELPVEGDTQDEQLAALRAAIGVNAFWKLNTLIGERIAEGQSRIVNRAETFHRDGTGDVEGVPGDGLDAGAV